MDVIARIAQTLASKSDTRAIEFRGRWYDWRAISDFADAVRGLLLPLGGAGMRVALVARNRPAHVAALLALLGERYRAAMVYPFQSAEHLGEEIRSMEVGAVIYDCDDASPELIAAIRAIGALGIAIDASMDVSPQATVAAGTMNPQAVQGTDVAIEMLTSGTTGRPKRVPIRTETINLAMADMIRAGAAGAAEILAFPISNIGGLYYLIPACANSAPLALLEKFALPEWLAAVALHRPAYCVLPPAAVRMILDADVPREALTGVGAVGVGAAPLSPELQDQFEQRYGIPILIGYGATEFCGVIAAWTPEDHKQFAADKKGSVGRARSGVSLRVVDGESGRELPVGETGILEARVARIGPDWVRTTDLVSIDADGFLFLHGRADDMINRGGFKVQPNKVEQVLAKHPAIAEVVVAGVPDERLGEVPVAVIELRPGSARPTEDEMHDFAHAHLRSTEVPARFVFVDALPRTPSMKVRRVEAKAIARQPV